MHGRLGATIRDDIAHSSEGRRRRDRRLEFGDLVGQRVGGASVGGHICAGRRHLHALVDYDLLDAGGRRVGGLSAQPARARLWFQDLKVLGACVGSSAGVPIMGQCWASPVASLACANGRLRLRSRVQTQYTYAEGGDGLWYTGTIMGAWSNETVSVQYDDGDVWTGKSLYCYLLPNGLPTPQPYGVPSQGAHVTPPGEAVVFAHAVGHAVQGTTCEQQQEAPVIGRPVGYAHRIIGSQ